MRYLAAVTILIGLCGFAHAGLFHDPEQPGHGVSVHSSPAGTALIWYTYSPEGEQAWFVTDTGQDGDRLDLYFPSGLFPSSAHSPGDPVGWIEFERDGDYLSIRYWVEIWEPQCTGKPQPGPLPPVCTGRLILELLAH